MIFLQPLYGRKAAGRFCYKVDTTFRYPKISDYATMFVSLTQTLEKNAGEQFVTTAVDASE